MAWLTQPVLIRVTALALLVGLPATVRAARALPDARLVNYGKASHHEILREADSLRDAALAEADAFLAGLSG